MAAVAHRDVSAPSTETRFGRLERLAASPAFAYATVLLLQLKMVWGMWNLRDLTPADTAYYFTAAHDWYVKLQTLFTWSPLYTAFYGSFLHITPDAYFATIAHRLVILAVIAILVLYTMRRFLPPGIAWLMTAWWVVLPIDFDSKYEVHLFSVIPLLAVVLLARWNSPWSLPAALATLFGTTVLIRNEYLIATVLFASALLIHEIRRLRGTSIYEKRKTAARYVGCLFIAVIAIGFFLFRASDRSKLARMESDKHTLNWCQVYTYGYQQRHSDFQGSPWSDCHDLMQRTFRGSQPSMIQSALANPSAMLGHLGWNASLVPNGLSLLLFNVTPGAVTPDYEPVPVNRAVAFGLGFLLLAVLITGAVLGRADHHLRELLQSQRWAWIASGCMAAVAISTMLTQRPRPSYLLAFGIFIRIAAGVSIWATLRKWPVPAAVRAAVPVIAALLILFVPPYYKQDPRNRPLLTAYRRLEPFQQQLESRPARLVVRGWGPELCNYLVAGMTSCVPFSISEIGAASAQFGNLTDAFDAQQINVLYIDSGIYRDPRLQQIMAGSPMNGWQTTGAGQIRDNHWALLYRAAMPAKIPEIVEPGTGVFIGRNWYPYERFEGTAFRWVNNDADIDIDPAVPVSKVLIDVQPGPALRGGRLHLNIQAPDRSTLARFELQRRENIEVKINPAAEYSYIRLHADDAGQATRTDPRVLNFRVFHIATDGPPPTEPKSSAGPAGEIVASGTGVHIASGWYPFEIYGGQQFRWINNDAEFFVDAGQGTMQLAFEVQPGPGAAGKPLHLRIVNDANAAVLSADVARLSTIEAKLPISPNARTRYRILVDGGGASVPNDPRILNLRVFRIRRSP